MTASSQKSISQAIWPVAAAVLSILSVFFLIIPFASRPARAEQPAPKKLRIGSTTYMGGKTDPKWPGLIDRLNRKLNAEFEIVEAKDAMQIFALMKMGQIDFAYMAPIDYLQAQRMFGAEALAVQLTPDHKPGYNAILIAKKSSGIKTLEQAQGKKLGFVAPDSVTGFKVPTYYMFKQMKKPISSFFSSTTFMGSHGAVIEGVKRGEIDVGATNTKDLKRNCDDLGLDPGQFNVIWTSGFIPESLFVARKDLPADLKNNFANALFSFNGDKYALEQFKIAGYAKPNDADFALIKELDAYLQKEKLAY
jgi:phosphonate transport system substrate-binding protein